LRLIIFIAYAAHLFAFISFAFHSYSLKFLAVALHILFLHFNFCSACIHSSVNVLISPSTDIFHRIAIIGVHLFDTFHHSINAVIALGVHSLFIFSAVLNTGCFSSKIYIGVSNASQYIFFISLHSKKSHKTHFCHQLFDFIFSISHLSFVKLTHFIGFLASSTSGFFTGIDLDFSFSLITGSSQFLKSTNTDSLLLLASFAISLSS